METSPLVLVLVLVATEETEVSSGGEPVEPSPVAAGGSLEGVEGDAAGGIMVRD